MKTRRIICGGSKINFHGSRLLSMKYYYAVNGLKAMKVLKILDGNRTVIFPEIFAKPMNKDEPYIQLSGTWSKKKKYM